jgi:hypothetical protein
MPQFIIERNVDGASTLSVEELAEISTRSNEVVAGLGVPYRWVTSYVAGDKIYCVYNPQGGLDPRARQQVGLPGQPHHASRGRHPPHHGRRVALSVTCAVALRLSAPST